MWPTVGRLLLPADMFPEKGVFAFRIVGDSMTGDHIFPGDYIVVDPGQRAEDGDIAAVRIFSRGTPGWSLRGRLVKRLRGNRTVLESSNPDYPPIVLKPGEAVMVEGVVIGVITPSATGLQARRI
jgi:DNA polymerase V